MITILLKILSKIRLANHSNKEKGNIISEDLLSIEPHKQECLNNLRNDLSSKSGKTKCARFEKRNVQKSGKTKRSKKFAHTTL